MGTGPVLAYSYPAGGGLKAASMPSQGIVNLQLLQVVLVAREDTKYQIAQLQVYHDYFVPKRTIFAGSQLRMY